MLPGCFQSLDHSKDANCGLHAIRPMVFLLVAASNDASARPRLPRRSVDYRSFRHQPPQCLLRSIPSVASSSGRTGAVGAKTWGNGWGTTVTGLGAA
ncbi:hypothetical protein C8R47DRAFT_1209336 [Mycena vitilis]|nr:hypothetical protein C8R47DRAFT_1209336 [Mycena vitilis]